MSIEVCAVCFLYQAGFKGRTQILLNAVIGEVDFKFPITRLRRWHQRFGAYHDNNFKGVGGELLKQRSNQRVA